MNAPAPESVNETSGSHAITPRHRFRRILVPVDFSPSSVEAIIAARALLAHSPAPHLTLLHVVEPLPSIALLSNIASPGFTESAFLELAWKQIRSLAMRYEDRIPITIDVQVGTPAQAIAAAAEAGSFDLVVMPSHGRSGFRRFAVGSVAEGVIHRVNCSVLVLKPLASGHALGARAPLFSKILVGYDHRPGSVRALEIAEELAEESGSGLLLAHALSPAGAEAVAEARDVVVSDACEVIEANMKLRWRQLRPQPQHGIIAGPGKPWEFLAHTAQEQQADLLVIGPHEHIERPFAFLGSTAQRLIRMAPCPVLAVK